MSDHSHDHSHSGEKSASKRALVIVLWLTCGFTVAEAIGGWLTNSLALLADAGHMLSDDFSIALALFARWIAEKPATPQRSFGFKRAEILAALANGLTLVAISVWIFVEAYHRLREPPQVTGMPMLIVACLGLLVNIIGAWILHRGAKENLNQAAAFRHMIADLLGSVGAITAAVIILVTGWRYADPLISVAIGILILVSSWGVLTAAVHILLEAAPAGLDVQQVFNAMKNVDRVENVHDLHIWTITSGFPALTAHVLVEPGADLRSCRRALEEILEHEFHIEHTTLQMDYFDEDTAAQLGCEKEHRKD